MELKARIKASGKLLQGKGPEIVQKNADEFIETAVLYLQAEVKQRTPVGVHGAEGGLLSTILTEVFDKGTPHIKGIVTSNSAYALPVEKGTKPHMPPTDPIKLWVQKRLGIEDEKESRQVAFAIAMKMKKKGTKGQFMFQNAWDKNLPKLRRMARELGFKITKELSQ